MKGTKLKIGLDVDDTLMSCIPYICGLLNEKGMTPPIRSKEFSSWGVSTPRTDAAYSYFADPVFYSEQPPIPGAQEMVRKLCRFADVFIISATAPEFMSARAKRIMEVFPEIPKENILLGSRKDVVDLDILFDDGAHNILSSKAKFPVLMRQPWNLGVSGRLTANNFDDFMKIVDTIRSSYTSEGAGYDMVCLVGPSGSGKHDIAKRLEFDGGYRPVRSYTTGDNAHHVMVTDKEFDSMGSEMFEMTYFAGARYGLSRTDIERVIADGGKPVIVTDICGAMTLKRTYSPLIVYCQRSEGTMIQQILRKGYSEEATVSRILSLRAEMENESLCDISVSGLSPEAACEAIKREIA